MKKQIIQLLSIAMLLGFSTKYLQAMKSGKTTSSTKGSVKPKTRNPKNDAAVQMGTQISKNSFWAPFTKEQHTHLQKNLKSPHKNAHNINSGLLLSQKQKLQKQQTELYLENGVPSKSNSSQISLPHATPVQPAPITAINTQPIKLQRSPKSNPAENSLFKSTAGKQSYLQVASDKVSNTLFKGNQKRTENIIDDMGKPAVRVQTFDPSGKILLSSKITTQQATSTATYYDLGTKVDNVKITPTDGKSYKIVDAQGRVIQEKTADGRLIRNKYNQENQMINQVEMSANKKITTETSYTNSKPTIIQIFNKKMQETSRTAIEYNNEGTPRPITINKNGQLAHGKILKKSKPIIKAILQQSGVEIAV